MKFNNLLLLMVVVTNAIRITDADQFENEYVCIDEVTMAD